MAAEARVHPNPNPPDETSTAEAPTGRAAVVSLFKRVTIWFALVAGGVTFALALWFATDWHARLVDEPTLAAPWQVIALFFVTAFAPLLPVWKRPSDRIVAAAFVFLGTSLGFALGMAYAPGLL